MCRVIPRHAVSVAVYYNLLDVAEGFSLTFLASLMDTRNVHSGAEQSRLSNEE